MLTQGELTTVFNIAQLAVTAGAEIPGLISGISHLIHPDDSGVVAAQAQALEEAQIDKLNAIRAAKQAGLPPPVFTI